jgi:SAM-dependent methyltransferase
MTRDEIVQLYDDAYAAAYEAEFLLAPALRSDTEAEVRLLERLLRPGVSWLDVACGTGYFLRQFPHVERAGLDLSPSMLKLAREGNPEIRLREHDFRDPLPEWNGRWGLVSCMWYAYGLVDSIPELLRVIDNIWSWTAPLGTAFVPLADPRLITGVNLPYQAPTTSPGRVMITGIQWSYVEEGGRKVHAHLLAPNVEFMVEQFARYYRAIEVVRYPPAFPGWQGRPALVASGRKPAPDAARI